MYTIALVDDHTLLRQGLSSLINSFQGYSVIFEAGNGKEFITQLNSSVLPQVVLMDITMPEMDGYETTKWLQTNYPQIRVIALSMIDNEDAIIAMLRSGAKGYLLKDTEPFELKMAIQTVIEKGYYFNNLVSSRLISSLKKTTQSKDKLSNLTEKEKRFMALACTEMSYNEIAEQLSVSPRTIENYRNSLCEKLQVKNRIGIVLYAVQNNMHKYKI